MTPQVLNTTKELIKIDRNFDCFGYAGGFNFVLIPYDIPFRSRNIKDQYTNTVETKLSTQEDEYDPDIAYELGRYEEFNSAEDLIASLRNK